jgi:hypothetical protein
MGVWGVWGLFCCVRVAGPVPPTPYKNHRARSPRDRGTRTAPASRDSKNRPR